MEVYVQLSAVIAEREARQVIESQCRFMYIYIYAVMLGGVWAGLRTEGETQSI